MAGLYVHIPFCRKACHYCDFHFSTNQGQRRALVEAMCEEIRQRAGELSDRKLSSIYFGGGTPSLLDADELDLLFATIHAAFDVEQNAEVTLEANPDDLTEEKLQELKRTPVNRLSIGIQSFREEDLQLMNRAHNAEQALNVVPLAKQAGFENLTIDLIYGIPGLDPESWQRNVETAISLNVPHLSAYCLTIEERTAFAHFIKEGKLEAPEEEAATAHYHALCKAMEAAGYRHYEVSNFARPGWEARHNASYWSGADYLGVGPSAHSFIQGTRSWNVSNNARYIRGIQEGASINESEQIDANTRYNEVLLTGLRTAKGIDPGQIKVQFGKDLLLEFGPQIRDWEARGLVSLVNGRILPSEEGFLWADGMAMEMMEV